MFNPSKLSHKLFKKTTNTIVKKALTYAPKSQLSTDEKADYFNGKVAAITGAGSGMGRELAIALASYGCEVALSDINESNLLQTQDLLNQYSVKSSIFPLDVSDRQQMEQWAEHVITQHDKVHFIFNNAGVALSATVEGSSYEEYEWIIGINFWGVVYGTKVFLPLIKEQSEGYIINTSSLFGLTAQPTQSGYNASKFAVRGFTEALQQELAMTSPHIGALSVHPGGIRTNIANSARMSDSINALGLNPETSVKKFNKLLVKSPKEASQEMIEAVVLKKRRVLIGNDAVIFDKVQRLMPTGYQKISQAVLAKQAK